jgi:hypothetical protein
MKEFTNELQLTACTDRDASPANDDNLLTRAHELPQSAKVIHGFTDGLKRSSQLSGSLSDSVLLVDWSLSGSRPFWRIHIIVNHNWPVYSTISKAL